jgi:hypothetical protein
MHLRSGAVAPEGNDGVDAGWVLIAWERAYNNALTILLARLKSDSPSEQSHLAGGEGGSGRPLRRALTVDAGPPGMSAR